MNRFTALVPIKGISERVPDKNMRDFCGVPLMHHILATLEEVVDVETVFVNTDSERVADYAKQFSKVVVHERPAHLCGNNVPMNSIIAYELDMSACENFLQTHTTNPLLSAKTINLAIESFINLPAGYDTLFSVTKYKSRFYDENHNSINHDPKILKNTQDLPPLYEENSCLYLFSKKTFIECGGNRIGKKPYYFTINKIDAQDIDTEEDFFMAELLWKGAHDGQSSNSMS